MKVSKRKNKKIDETFKGSSRVPRGRSFFLETFLSSVKKKKDSIGK
jgi:hypothetical protein